MIQEKLKSIVSRQFVISMGFTLFYAVTGYQVGATSPIIKELKNDPSWHRWTTLDSGLFGSSSNLGCICGVGIITCIQHVYTLDRRTEIAISTIPTSLGVGKSISYMSIPLYTSEVCDADLRGIVGSMFGIVYLSGRMVSFLLSIFIDRHWLCIPPLITTLVGLFTVLFPPDTPRWYVINGQIENAKNSLRWFNKNKNLNIEDKIKEIKHSIKKSPQKSPGFKAISSNPLYYKPWFTVFIFSFQPVFYCFPIFVYLENVLQAVRASHQGTISTGLAIWQVVFSIVGIFVVKRFKRKFILSLSHFGMSAALVVFALYCSFFKNWIISGVTNKQLQIFLLDLAPTTIIALLFFFYSIGMQNILLLVVAEQSPNKLRSKLMSQYLILVYFGQFLTTFTYNSIVDVIGMGPFFALNALCLTSLTIVYLYFAPETKDKCLEEIEASYSSRHWPCCKIISNNEWEESVETTIPLVETTSNIYQ